MNILYIGSSGALSLTPFKKLLASNHTVSAVGVFNPVVFQGKVIALENESLALAANQHGLPVIDLSQPLVEVIEQCKEYSIDVILMSCYSRRLPDALITIADKGCFNMHPSLLPQYRGSEPIFWQMQEESGLGVSWHKVIEEFDAGNIVRQQKVSVCEGATYAEINLQLAEKGAELMIKLLSDIFNDAVNQTIQNPETASYYPYPQQHDFVIDCHRSAQYAYNFMRATQAFGFFYLCKIKHRRYFLEAALDYDNNASLETAEIKGDKLYIPFSDGVLVATYTDKM